MGTRRGVRRRIGYVSKRYLGGKQSEKGKVVECDLYRCVSCRLVLWMHVMASSSSCVIVFQGTVHTQVKRTLQQHRSATTAAATEGNICLRMRTNGHSEQITF